MKFMTDDRARLLAGRHFDPHSFYGRHGSTVRTRKPGARRVEVHSEDGTTVRLEPTGDDIWEGELSQDIDYRLRVFYDDPNAASTDAGDTAWEVADAYRFLPTLGELDLQLFGEGRHERLWEVLGAREKTYDTAMGAVSGTAFAVWAPGADGVAVIGDFCGWNPAQYPMRTLGSSGVWELFIPGVRTGALYKFAIFHDGTRTDKADPLARRAQCPPETASIVEASDYEWSTADTQWMADRDRKAASETDAGYGSAGYGGAQKPMSVYEVHIGSWKQGSNYERLTTELVDYVTEHGFTHVEFLPVAEHPFGGSWGYQVTGYYAPTARWGTPDQFRALVDALHAAGIGVIVDWVPAHFPRDQWALGRFTGHAVYEHPDPRRGEQADWGTFVFDFGRNEVRNFLVANALYWAEVFHVDGLRVDAVASMLYLDYSREDWVPNIHGGRENLEAIQFLQEMNATLHREHPGVLTIAEESTAWPGVTRPTTDGGLGFSLKWNMGWMNDTLRYFSHDPIHRSYHHGELTFSLVYAHSERYVLPLSHDEVVHGKGTLWTRMPGDNWNKAAGVRTLFGYMFSHPGKNLMFMGCEFGQVTEWAEASSVDWANLAGWGSEWHHGIKRLVNDLNAVYTATPALWTQDDVPGGFEWMTADDAANNVIAYARYGTDGSIVLAVVNLAGVSHPTYGIRAPRAGEWEMVINTDDAVYQGAGNDLPRLVTARDAFDGQGWLELHLPANSVQWYRWNAGA